MVDQFRIKPYVAGGVWLNKYDLNTLLQTQENSTNKFQLKFDKGTTNENLWDQTPYEAVDPVGKNTLAYGEVQDAEAAAKNAQTAWEESVGNVKKANDLIASSNDELSKLWNERLVAETKVAKTKALQAKYNADKESLVDERGQIETDLATLEEALKNEGFNNEQLQEELTRLSEQKEIQRRIRDGVEGKVIAKDGELAEFVADKELAEVAKGLYTSIKETNQEVITWIKSTKQYSDTNERTVSEMYSWYVEQDHKSDICNEDELSEAGYAALIAKVTKFYNEGKGSVKIKFNGTQSNSDEFLKEVISDRDDADTGIKTQEAKIAQAEENINTCTAELKDLNVQLAAENKKLADMQETINEKLQAADSSDDAVKQLQDEIEKKNNELTECNENISDVDLKIKECIDTILETDALISEINDQIDLTFGENLRYIYFAQLARNAEVKARYAFLQANAYYTHLNAVKSPYWLSLRSEKMEDGVNTYMMVDTAYVTNNAGDQNLAFAVRKHQKDFEDVNNPMNARDINGRFNFRFFYYPTEDSMRIEADGFNRKAVTTKYWKDRTDNEIDLRSSYIL